MFKRRVSIGRATVLIDNRKDYSVYSLKEWLAIDRLLRRQKIRGDMKYVF